MATKHKRRQWMIDDPNVPESAGPRDLLVQLPSGDKVSVQSVFWAALHIAREERGVPLDIEQNEDEFAAWLETEFGGALEFVRWFELLGRGDQEKLRPWRSRWIGRTDRGPRRSGRKNPVFDGDGMASACCPLRPNRAAALAATLFFRYHYDAHIRDAARGYQSAARYSHIQGTQ